MSTIPNTLTPEQAKAVPPAMFAKPLFRYRLVLPEETSLGYALIDVIAIFPPGRPVKPSKAAFPYFVCLALGSGNAWSQIDIFDVSSLEDLNHAYEVVS